MKEKIVIEMAEVDARMLMHMADLVLFSIETCQVFDEHYRAQHGNEIGYPPAPLPYPPSVAVQRACSSIAIALSAARDEARDATDKTPPPWEDDDLPF